MIDRLSQLRSFVAVVDAGHFGRAADAVGLGQSAVSQHVRAIEDDVGTPLLARTSRRVDLTAAGERFAPAARRLLADAERAVAEARAVGAGELGTLRVAAQQAARGLVLPGALAHLARESPGLVLDVRPATTAEGIAAVQERRVDVALARDPDPREGVRTEVLATDPIMIVLAAGHRLADRPRLALSRLRDEPRIGWGREGAPDFHDRLDAVLRGAGVDPVPRMELRSVDVRLGAVAAGLGYALESAAYRWILPDALAFVAIEGEPLRGAIAAAWPAVRPAPGVEAFLAAARAAVSAPRQSRAAASADGSVTGARQAKPSQT